MSPELHACKNRCIMQFIVRCVVNVLLHTNVTTAVAFYIIHVALVVF